MKPADYREPRIITQETPYQVEEGDLKGTHAGSGVLHTGRVVWIQKGADEYQPESRLPSYAEGVGIVHLEPHLLRPMA